MFTGCGTALVTPFQKNGSLDEATLRRLVRRQIEQGIDFSCPAAPTGESPTLTREGASSRSRDHDRRVRAQSAGAGRCRGE